jgi:hypothetical protein
MSQRIKSNGPYVPEEPSYFERADRDSIQPPPVKPKNLLAAIMGVNQAADAKKGGIEQKHLDFDQAHYEKFEREVKKVQDENELASPEGKQ